MSLFFRLSTVAAIAVLLRCIPATVVITAPSTLTDSTAGLETREQGPTAWICSVLAVDSPWTAYANIRGYLEGGNAEKKDFSNLVLYPVMELFHASQSRLCVYLPAEDHCFPPAPSTSQVKAVKQLSTKIYYAIRFWGQASDARVQYYKQKLTAALNTLGKAANFDLFFVSFFSDHVREVRYDPATTGQGKSLEPSKSLEPLQRQPGTCFDDTSPTKLLAGQDYLLISTSESRMSLSDVNTTVVPGDDVKSTNACALASSNAGKTAFSFVNGLCKLYDLGKNFCACAAGGFDIFIDKKQLGMFKELIGEKLEPEAVKQMVIYTEIPLNHKALLMMSYPIETIQAKGGTCATALRDSILYFGAFVTNGQCYLSYFHDFDNCNQTCRGQPVDLFVIKKNRFPPSQPILSLCGQKISIPIKNESRTNVLQPYISHAGFGCYPYQGAKTAEGEDCIVTFEKRTNVAIVVISVMSISLNSEGSTCLDVLSIYDGNTTAVASRKHSGCSGPAVYKMSGDITINFHRKLGSEKNFGFKLNFRIG